jgi:uncharacterized protein YjbI with pentapeptide repeats
LRDRDLNCSIVSNADLRRVDLTGARMSGAILSETDFQGASLDGAWLQDTSFRAADLQDASLGKAHLQLAYLQAARLQRAFLWNAELQGATLDDAQLQRAYLGEAQLQGASLNSTLLHGASLHFAQLQGASLGYANLQGAVLDQAKFQGAVLSSVDLQGASLVGAEFQGAWFYEPKMSHSLLDSVYTWRAQGAACMDARVTERLNGPIGAMATGVTKFIEDSIAGIPDVLRRERTRNRMQNALIVDPANDNTVEIDKSWNDCEQESSTISAKEWDKLHADFLRQLICEDAHNGKAIAEGVILHWTITPFSRGDLFVHLKRGLLDRDSGDCAGMRGLDESYKERLRDAAP